MARKQNDYLAQLLAAPEAVETGAVAPPAPPPRERGLSLLNRETALARVASGEVRQVTQLALDPARCRIWSGNARAYARLNEAACRELIDSLIAEGGQKVPAIIRRIEGDPAHDYEVIAGTRRHWAISWLRANSYPDMVFVAQVHVLDDEAAFRIADIENRAHTDVSDIERARNYAQAMQCYYGGHLTRMAERLNISKGWLSKMVKVAGLPDAVLDAFASLSDVQLKPTYPLAQALDDPAKAKAIVAMGRVIAGEQAARRDDGHPPLPAADVLRRLLDAPHRAAPDKPEPYVAHSRYQRPILTVTSAGRQGVTVKLHAGSGAKDEEVIDALRRMLEHLRESGTAVLM
jgi:ParB family transcriptional regulator, chromosome partitioning protein